MARGGYRPGAGRPKKGERGALKQAAKEARIAGLSPLDYMLKVMRDPKADKARRDRMAIAAAPFCHERAADTPKGKKEAADDAAQTAGQGTEWGNDLEPPNIPTSVN